MNIKTPLKALVLALSLICGGQALAAPPLTVQQEQQAAANAWLEIDTQAFEHNVATVQALLAGKSQLCAIMKADAYGNGLDLLMPSVIKMNIPCIGIASNEEARVIRAHGYQGKIVRVRSATLNEIRDGINYQMEELLGDLTQAQAVSALAAEAGKEIAFHLALNSAGMNRNGLDLGQDLGKQEALQLLQLPHLKLAGIMTHFPIKDAAVTVRITKR